MRPALFLQSDLTDLYAFYQSMRSGQPVYWDGANQLWATYSYKDCAAVLNNQSAHIPPINKNGLNEYALRITDHVVRLSNQERHQVARAVAITLAGSMQQISTAAIMETLMSKGPADWVEAVCKKLPAIAILKSFAFSEADTAAIVDKTADLVKIMLPQKTPEQVIIVNTVSAEIYRMVEKHLLANNLLNTGIASLAKKYSLEKETVLSLLVSNLAGFVIQGYDAGRGILSNTLLQLVNKRDLLEQASTSDAAIEKIIIETLRFDPPVQNTRRLAAETMLIRNMEIKKGQAILVVMAAANRDPQQFANAATFDAERINNHEHLTFGSGTHLCVANHFSVSLAATSLSWLLTRFKNIILTDTHIDYEPLINVRLPKKIMIDVR